MKHERGHLVVGVDGSDGGRGALAYALVEAARRGAAVEVVTVVARPEYWVPFHGLPTISIDEIREKVREGTEQIVRDAIAGLEDELVRPPPVTVRVESGAPAHALLCRADGADLLVIGRQGRGAVGSRLLGSVGLSCVLHASCPVTVVHGTERMAKPEKVGAAFASERAPTAD